MGLIKKKTIKSVPRIIEEPIIEGIEEEVEEIVEEEETEEQEPTKEKPKKEITIQDVLANQEQRLIQMESKWFRLGGL